MRRTAALIALVLVSSGLAEWPALAVYALSGWHYLFYWWAYRYRRVWPSRFRRDAFVMKTVALVALASAYLAQPWHWPSAVVMAAGFLLNALGAKALGRVRTYYGVELGEVRARRINTFPFSVLPHPMLVGNVVAFGGTFLNADFRRAWWPLASLHVALNVALLVMELTGPTTTTRPPRIARVRVRRPLVAGLWAGVGMGIAALGAAALRWPAGWAPLTVVVGASAAYGHTQSLRYVPAAGAIMGLSYVKSSEVV